MKSVFLENSSRAYQSYVWLVSLCPSLCQQFTAHTCAYRRVCSRSLQWPLLFEVWIEYPGQKLFDLFELNNCGRLNYYFQVLRSTGHGRENAHNKCVIENRHRCWISDTSVLSDIYGTINQSGSHNLDEFEAYHSIMLTFIWLTPMP